MTVQQEPCPDCGRTVWEEGPNKRVEAARDQDGKEAFCEWVEAVLARRNRQHHEHLSDLAIRLEVYCATGTLPIPRELNHLQDEVWEFKIGTLRAPFFPYNTGTPTTDRITHGFFKNSWPTPRHEIRRALAIMRKDRLQ